MSINWKEFSRGPPGLLEAGAQAAGLVLVQPERGMSWGAPDSSSAVPMGRSLRK